MADPTVIECVSTCTVTVVHVLSIPFLDISIEDAQEIAKAILLVWAIGWVYRQLSALISSKSGSNSTESEP